MQIPTWDGRTINLGEAADLRSALEAAAKGGANLRRAVLRHADLSGADLRRADLRLADLSGAVLSDAVLGRADLGGAVLRHADLRHAILRHADLRYADLRYADLRYADLMYADLMYADLMYADLSLANMSGAVGLPSAPVVAGIDAAILAQVESGRGSLDMGNWHICDTTHCRAGWAIVLAGEPGWELELRFGPSVAGALIYAASRPGLPLPNFHCSTDEAIADLRACARRAGAPDAPARPLTGPGR